MPPHKYAEAFRVLADKIDKTDEKDFAGAFLIIPPDGKGISGIIIGGADMASFFGMVKTKLDMAVADADEAQKRQRGFGR